MHAFLDCYFERRGTSRMNFYAAYLHIMMRLITPDVALPWRMRARARESLSTVDIRLKSAPGFALKKRNPRLYYRPTGSDVLLPSHYLVIRQ